MNEPATQVTPATIEHLDALLAGDEVFAERFGMPVEPLYMDLPDEPEMAEQALTWSKTVLEEGAPPEWQSHLFIEPDEPRLIGFGGYKGAPQDGAVEIGYALAPTYRGRGHATAAARELIRRAREAGLERVLAHTLPEHNPSTRLLERLGFDLAGEVADPDDGSVWRWELDLTR